MKVLILKFLDNFIIVKLIKFFIFKIKIKIAKNYGEKD